MMRAWALGGVVVLLIGAAASNRDARKVVGETVSNAADSIRGLIAKFEGYSSTVYQDDAGYWTIGYGHLVKPGERFYPHGQVTEISEHEAKQLLIADTAEASQCVDAFVNVPLTDNQRAALTSFVFNTGCGAFKRSTLLKRLNASDYIGAADELDRWVHAGGVKLAGLVKRRALEKETFLA